MATASLRRLLLAACGSLLVGLGIGACGSSHRQSDSQLVTQALHSYLHAQVAGDGQTACALLTPAGQRQLVTLVVRAGKGLITTRPSCNDAVRLVQVGAGTQLLNALDSARIQNVQVSGDRASAQVVDGGQFPPQRVTLEKVSGSWKIAAVPGLGG